MVFRKLFGGGKEKAKTRKEAAPVKHEGYVIVPSPLEQPGGWYVAGRIELTAGDDTRTHEFVRADTHADWDQAVEHTVQKAIRVIDEQGERIFAS